MGMLNVHRASSLTLAPTPPIIKRRSGIDLTHRRLNISPIYVIHQRLGPPLIVTGPSAPAASITYQAMTRERETQ